VQNHHGGSFAVQLWTDAVSTSLLLLPLPLPLPLLLLPLLPSQVLL
jgi:hypothetical protein